MERGRLRASRQNPFRMTRFAILLDGEFVRKTLRKEAGPATVEGVMEETRRICGLDELGALELYRIFFYTADPLAGGAVHPLTGVRLDFSGSRIHRDGMRFNDLMENQPNVAVRRGTLVHQGWALGSSAEKALIRGRKAALEPGDLVPRIQQKGVDMRIGLDIAALALKRLVSTIVVVSGDSDLVPALKLARREGLRVILDSLGFRHARPELRKHADRVL